MSECKHEFSTTMVSLNGDRFPMTFCKNCRMSNVEIDLRAKLGITEKECEYWKNEACKVSTDAIDLAIEHNELFPKVKQLEPQVAVMRGALGNVKLSVHKAHREKSISDTYYDLIIFGNINPLLESTPEELVQKAQELENYAELGRLALTTRAMVCSNTDFIKRGPANCEDHCVNFNYCRLRAELKRDDQS